MKKEGRLLLFPPVQQRLAIEAPPKKDSMCMFHLTSGHDGKNFLEMVRLMQIESQMIF